jgi:hypothetical protein
LIFITDYMGHKSFLRRLQCLLAVCTVVPLLGNAQTVQPDSLKPAISTTPSKGIATQPAPTGQPLWSELTPSQQQALQPLTGTWGTISEAQKRKWLAVSKNYSSLPPLEQATMHGRMNEWVSLSPLQRAEARLNFATTKELSKQLTSEEKLAKWQTYQSLSAEEKQELAQKARTKPTGAALAIKPVAPQKLVPVQPHRPASAPQAAKAP